MPGPIKLLLVEDNPVDSTLVKALLSDSGMEFAITLTESLEVAIRHLRKERFDIVLLDLTLPDSQGLETLTLLQPVANETPIVVLTGQEDNELSVEALSKGAQDYLFKSRIDTHSLLRSIRYTLERMRRQRAEAELSTAGAIQARLFPGTAPKAPGFDFAGRCQPATFAGGDFFDYFLMGRNKLGVVVADVAGHGLGPAITMSETRAVVRAFASVTHDLGEILTRAGNLLARDLNDETFVALFLARIDVGGRTVQFATAGHPGLILTNKGRPKQLLKSDSPPLGVERSVVYEASPEIPLDEGDTVFLFTDGFAEAVSPQGEAFGKQRVFEAIRSKYELGAEAMLDALFEQVSVFRQDASPEDDMTAVVVKASSPVAQPMKSPEAMPEPVAEKTEATAAEAVAHEEYAHFQVDHQGEVAVVSLSVEEILNSQICAEIRGELNDYIQEHQLVRLVISFDSVQRFSSEGINICFHVKSALDAMDGQLRLCGMHPQLREAFGALNLDGTVFQIHDDVGDALGSF